MGAIRLGHAFQRFAAGGGSYGKNFAQQRMGLRGEMQQPDAPVPGMGAPLDELRLKSGRTDSTLEDVFLHLVTKPQSEAA